MRVLPTSLLLAAGLALGACGPVNRGLESVNQPVVKRTDYVFDVNSGGLGNAEEKRLADWFDALDLRYGDHVSIDGGSGDVASRQAISAIVARYGLFVDKTPPITRGSDQLSGLRVIVSRNTATIPNCPNWDRASQPELAASTMSNFGCATNVNLARMVANPADLIQGQSIGDNDPVTITRAIKSYRDQDPTGKGELKTEKAGSGGQ